MKPALRPVRTVSIRTAPSRRCRFVSSTSNARSSIASTDGASTSNFIHPPPQKSRSGSPLAILPLSTVLRSLLILSISSSPILLKPCIYALSVLANPKNPVLDVARNPFLNWLVKNTIYKQFNAGENKIEVQRSIEEMKRLGYRGVLLGYAREVLVGDSKGALDEKAARQDVETWLKGTLQTVDMAHEGDFVALKYASSIQSFIPLGLRLIISPDLPEWVLKLWNYYRSNYPRQTTSTPPSGTFVTPR